MICVPCIKVVHPNLKFVLLIQSAVIVLWSVCGITQTLIQLISQNVANFGPIELLFVFVFADQFVNLIGHILLIERVAATGTYFVFVKNTKFAENY